jgi:hypothetical protein
MARVPVSVEEADVENDEGRMIPGVIVTCDRCGESVEVFGTEDDSIKRGCVMLREQCGSRNFYVYDEYRYDPDED